MQVRDPRQVSVHAELLELHANVDFLIDWVLYSHLFITHKKQLPGDVKSRISRHEYRHMLRTLSFDEAYAKKQKTLIGMINALPASNELKRDYIRRKTQFYCAWVKSMRAINASNLQGDPAHPHLTEADFTQLFSVAHSKNPKDQELHFGALLNSLRAASPSDANYDELIVKAEITRDLLKDILKRFPLNNLDDSMCVLLEEKDPVTGAPIKDEDKAEMKGTAQACCMSFCDTFLLPWMNDPVRSLSKVAMDDAERERKMKELCDEQRTKEEQKAAAKSTTQSSNTAINTTHESSEKPTGGGSIIPDVSYKHVSRVPENENFNQRITRETREKAEAERIQKLEANERRERAARAAALAKEKDSPLPKNTNAGRTPPQPPVAPPETGKKVPASTQPQASVFSRFINRENLPSRAVVYEMAKYGLFATVAIGTAMWGYRAWSQRPISLPAECDGLDLELGNPNSADLVFIETVHKRYNNDCMKQVETCIQRLSYHHQSVGFLCSKIPFGKQGLLSSDSSQICTGYATIEVYQMFVKAEALSFIIQEINKLKTYLASRGASERSVFNQKQLKEIKTYLRLRIQNYQDLNEEGEKVRRAEVRKIHQDHPGISPQDIYSQGVFVQNGAVFCITACKDLLTDMLALYKQNLTVAQIQTIFQNKLLRFYEEQKQVVEAIQQAANSNGYAVFNEALNKMRDQLPGAPIFSVSNTKSSIQAMSNSAVTYSMQNMTFYKEVRQNHPRAAGLSCRKLYPK